MKVTNTSEERQAVHTTSGVVFIHPGRSREVQLTPEGEKFVDASPALSIDGRPRKTAKKDVSEAEEGSE